MPKGKSGMAIEVDLSWIKDGKDEIEIYINGWYLSNIKIADLSNEAKEEINFPEIRRY